MTGVLLPLHPLQYDALLRRALEEDLGLAGDLTTNSVVPPEHRGEGRLVARTGGRLAGLDVATRVFALLDPTTEVEALRRDGDDLATGATIAVVRGASRTLLTGERVALNVLGRLSGIATTTRDLVAAVADTGARVACTRKTTPGLRALEKYAVRAGGGSNHRFGLDDAVLVKDNHIVVAGGVGEAIRRVREAVGHLVKVEVEVDDLEQLAEALEHRIDAVLLDNMAPPTLRRAVEMCGGSVVTEASGGITPTTARAIAESGVDLLSVGWLTHSAPALDVALDLDLDLR